MTPNVERLRTWGREELKHSSAAALETDLLLAAALGLRSVVYLLGSDRDVSSAEQQRYEELIARRKTGEPIAYIRGRREFFSRDFCVSPSVLVPRPETELLVERALRHFSADSDAFEIVDVGTGSGNIIVTIAAELRESYGEAFLQRGTFTAIDISEDALEIAKKNAQMHRIDRIDFRCGNLLEPLAAVGPAAQSRLVVSNPPYIPVGDELPKDVVDFEPHTALFSGERGMNAIDGLVRQWKALEPRPREDFLLFEIGYGQDSDVESLLQSVGVSNYLILKDFQGIPRVTEVEFPSDS